MAGDQHHANLATPSTQHAGVKRTRAQERQPPRKSPRLEKLHRDKPTPPKSTHHQQKSTSRKRPRTQSSRVAPAEPTEQKKSPPAPPGDLSEDEEHPIAYWAANQQWPRKYFEKGNDMQNPPNILARRRSISVRSRKVSDTDSMTPSSTNQSEEKSRGKDGAEYKRQQYETILANKGVFMDASPQGVSSSSMKWCEDLLSREQQFPEDTLFRDDLFASTCSIVRRRNETRVIRDMALLIVPSAENLARRGATGMRCLIESVNEGWNNCIPITKTRPQPDFAVGFCCEAFSQDQLARMKPIIGDFDDHSYFLATWYTYFPFLTCEVKCGTGALDVADRQNAHSTAIAVRAVVELFRAVKREKELHREILAFSVSHDHSTVRIYGHYPEFDGAVTKYYRHLVHHFGFTAFGGREKWTAYRFTKNVYDHWMPMHFKRICSAIDQIPSDISFSVSHSELRFSDRSSGMSQGFSTWNIAQSSAGTPSGEGRDNTQSSFAQNPVVTPGTSVTEGASKRPRLESNRGRK